MKHRFVIIFFLALASTLIGQDFSFEDLIGDWEGEITSETTYQWNSPTNISIYADGFYTESTGILMPSIYPNTQEVTYDATTNRVHFKYLYLVYAGQHTYQHHYFELISYNGNDIEMHYNFWDDTQAHPEVMTITLSRVNVEEYGSLSGSVYDNYSLSPLSYVNIEIGQYTTTTDMYGSYNIELPVGTYQISLNHPGYQEIILNDIMVYPNENNPINIGLDNLIIPPSSLTYQLDENNIVLNWSLPQAYNLTGYNIYMNDQIIDTVMENTYSSSIANGEFSFYVTALYGQVESEASNIINVTVQQVTSNSNQVSELSELTLNNYPNPFNPSTSISFNLPENSRVNLAIYDLKGRKVTELINQELLKGQHSYKWNGRDSKNRSLASGIYFYTLRTNNASLTKKMIMQK